MPQMPPPQMQNQPHTLGHFGQNKTQQNTSSCVTPCMMRAWAASSHSVNDILGFRPPGGGLFSYGCGCPGLVEPFPILFRRILLIELTEGTLYLSQTPSASNLSRISHANIPGSLSL
jgi:hypothetical protein